MSTLTYRNLGPEAADLLGQVLGADFTGWPLVVASVKWSEGAPTLVAVEPWPLPAPGDSEAAAALAAARQQVDAGQHAEIGGAR